MSRIKLGKALEAKRIKKGLNINEVSKMTGLSWIQVRNIELAKTDYTSTSLDLYCKAVGIKLDELISKYA
jgi:transcriptional regulator with XRE-family HTH domain